MLGPQNIARVPLAPAVREISQGIYRLEDKLLVVLDVERLLDQDQDTVQTAAQIGRAEWPASRPVRIKRIGVGL